MEKRIVFGTTLILLLANALAIAPNVQYACASSENFDSLQHHSSEPSPWIENSEHMSSFTFTYSFSEPKIEEASLFSNGCLGDERLSSWVSVSMDDLPKCANTGLPVLPFKTAKILLPFGTRFEQVKAVGGRKTLLSRSYLVEYGRKPAPLSTIESADAPAMSLPNETIYGSENPFPNRLYSDVSVQSKMGYKILLVNLHPVEYIPKTGTLSYLQSIRLEVKVTPENIGETSGFLGYLRQSEIVKGMVDNPEMLGTYPTSGETPLSEYVIITDEALGNTPGPYNFQALIDDKISRGISATIVTVEWIYANYNGTRPDGGQDNQTKIRNFISDACKNWGTMYVLLGGDGDGANVGGESGNTIVPHRGFASVSGEIDLDIPADMYYGCLDGTFDYNCNGVYGEPSDGPDGGEVDLFAEVYVGRACVDSQLEVQNFVRKTLAYQNTPADLVNLRKAVMVGEYLGFGGVADWGGNHKDEIKEGSDAYGYTTIGFKNSPYADEFDVPTLYDRDYPGNDWPKSEIIDVINNDVHLMNHLGHAYVDYVMKMYNPDVDSLTNDQLYFIGYSQGCYSGSFDDRTDMGSYIGYDCISEHLTATAHGASAFISNSRYGWGIMYSTDGPSQHYDREFWDAVLGESITNIGIANQDSKEDNAGRVGSWVERYCYYEINLFGDPELKIKAPPAYQHELKMALGAPTYLEPGNPSLLNATVYNKGLNNETNVELSLLINGTTVETVIIPMLVNETSYTIDYLWTPPFGIYNVTAYAAPVPNETIVENNSVSKYVFVGIKTIGVPTHFPTIQEAVDAAGQGFTILVSLGTYRECVVLNKAVSLIGENKTTTIVDAGNEGSAITITADGATVSDFTLKNSAGGASYGSGVYLQGVGNCRVTNNSIVSNRYGVYLYLSSDSVLSGNNISSNTYAVWIFSSSNIQLSDNTLVDNYQGILAEYSPGNVLSNNTMTDNGYGILLRFSPDNLLVNNTLACNNYGIRLFYSANSVLSGNALTANRYNFGISYDFAYGALELSHFIQDIDTSNLVDGRPIYYLVNQNSLSINPSTCPSIGYLAIINSTSIVAENLTLSKNMQGILLAYSSNSVVKNNTLTNNAFDGLMLYYASNNTVIDNTLGNNYEGIFSDSSSNNILSGNTITSHYYAGILLDCSDSNILSSNTVTNTTLYGIYVSSSSNNTLSHNIVKYNGFDRNNKVDGIRLFYSFYNRLSANVVTNNAYAGIRLEISSNNTLSDNTATNNDICGIYLSWNSNNNVLQGNTLRDNNYGMWIDYSSNDVLSGNILAGNRYNLGVSGSELLHYVHDIDTSNFADGEPIYYLKNLRNVVINSLTHPQIGYMALVNSTNVTVENVSLTKNTQGLLLVYTNNSVIRNNAITNNFFGIRLAYSYNNTVMTNTISNNAYNVWLDYSSDNTLVANDISNGAGIYLNLSYNNTLSANTLITNYGWFGIYLRSSDGNTLSGNSITNGSWFGGIRLEYSSNNLLIGNNITNNYNYGILLSYSSGNFIFHNNFVNNKIQAYHYPTGYSNIWDDGYPSGGNYWNDYAGVDYYMGPYQNQTGSDGIGDTPYIIDTYNQDHYPLMDPWVLRITVDKVFSPSEISVKRKGAVKSITNITNTGDADIIKLTYEDTILSGWTLSNSPISVSIIINGTRYQIPYAELAYVAIEDGKYTVQIDFNTGIDLYQVVYVETIYSFEPGWIIEFSYSMFPPETLQPGQYSSAVSVTATSPEGLSTKVEDTATLIVTS